MFKAIKRFFSALLILALLAALLLGYARYVEPYRLTTSELTITADALPKSSSPLTIALFADTHFSEYYTPQNFEKVIKTINDQNPDIIFFCGDLIDDLSAYSGDVAEISDALSRLSASMGKFAVYGNHDHGGGAHNAYPKIMEAGGFTVLTNEYTAFDDLNIGLVGLDDFIFGEKDPTPAEWMREDYFNLVLCHEPDVADLILECNVDFMASGHTHGGQINLPFYKHVYYPSYGQKYLKGEFTLDNERQTTLYVNSGIGMTKLPFRFMAPPEVTLITLTP